MNTTTEGKALAIVAGALCALATVGILLEDVLLHDAQFTLKHALTVVVIGVTIAMGELSSRARNSRRYLAMFGFGILFLAGTSLTVFWSVGRQAEHVIVASAEVEAAAKARSAAQAGLDKEQKRLENARADLASECKTGKGPKCSGIRETIGVYEAAVKGHKAELERLGPAKVAVPEAVRAGEIAAVFGSDPKKVEAAAILLVPFAMTVFFEIGSILGLAYGFRPVRKTPVNDNAQNSFSFEPLPPAKQLPPLDKTLPALKGENVVDWSKRYFAKHGEWPKLNQIEAAFAEQIEAGEFSRSTAYRRVKALKAA